LKNSNQDGTAFLAREIGTIACAATDVIIAACLLYTFIRLEKTSVVQVSMRSLLHRLMILILTSGVVVASTTLFTMVFLLRGNIGASTMFFFIQGRVYAVTVLANILIPSLPKTSNAPGTLITLFRANSTSNNGHTETGMRNHDRHSELPDVVDMRMISPAPVKSRTDSD